MKRLALLTAAIASATLVAGSAAFAKPPTNWDGLVQVKSKRLDLVYLQPGADFRGYTKVLVEPTEVAFAKNWQRDYNRGSRALSARVSDRDVQDAVTEGVRAASSIFTDAWTKGGYAVVTEPGPDVLRVKTGIVNITVTAPEQSTAGRSYSFSGEAGFATLFVEARGLADGCSYGARHRSGNCRPQQRSMAHRRQQSRRLPPIGRDLGKHQRARNNGAQIPTPRPAITSPSKDMTVTRECMLSAHLMPVHPLIARLRVCLRRFAGPAAKSPCRRADYGARSN